MVKQTVAHLYHGRPVTLEHVESTPLDFPEQHLCVGSSFQGVQCLKTSWLSPLVERMASSLRAWVLPLLLVASLLTRSLTFWAFPAHPPTEQPWQKAMPADIQNGLVGLSSCLQLIKQAYPRKAAENGGRKKRNCLPRSPENRVLLHTFLLFTSWGMWVTTQPSHGRRKSKKDAG